MLLLHPGTHLRGLGGGGLQRLAIPHELDADKQAHASDVSDERPAGRQTLQATPQVSAHLGCIFLQSLVPQHIQHRKARSAADGVAPEGVEVFEAVVEGLRDRLGGDDSRQGHAVTEGLAQCDHVGRHTLLLECPEVLPEAAEAHLHLVGHADAAGRAHRLVAARQVSGRWQYDTSDRHAGLHDESGHLAALRTLAGCRDVLSITFPGIGPTVGTSERVGARHLVHVALLALTPLVVELVRADLEGLNRVPVVPVVDDDDLPALRAREGQAHRQVVGLGTGVHEEADLQAASLRERCRQALRQEAQVRVQVSCVRVQQRHLICNGLRHTGMRMPDMADVVASVQKLAPALVVQPGPGSAHDHQRVSVGIRDALCRRGVPVPEGQDFGLVQGLRLLLEAKRPPSSSALRRAQLRREHPHAPHRSAVGRVAAHGTPAHARGGVEGPGGNGVST
mmetsp:Transcript_51979/g.149075  ORF Transcript_51979/g.149075 Transcript_51979/m.149075 type:complete len:451 (+) Transcript_51979:309-1661(+)